MFLHDRQTLCSDCFEDQLSTVVVVFLGGGSGEWLDEDDALVGMAAGLVVQPEGIERHLGGGQARGIEDRTQLLL